MALQPLLIYFFLLTIGFSIDSSLASDVQKAFKAYDIVPDIISEAPQAQIQVNFGCGCCKRVKLGNELTPTEAMNAPKVSFEADETKYYTFVMLNYDVPSQANHSMGEYCYWLIGNIPGSKVYKGETIIQYVGPAPPKGTCFHRYVLLVYEQPDKLNFDEKRIDNMTRVGRYYFNITRFSNKYGLGSPIAGNFFVGQYDKFVDVVDMRLGPKVF